MITPFRDEDFSESMEEIQGAACITRNGAEQIGYGKFALIRREEQLVRNVSAREKQKLSRCVLSLLRDGETSSVWSVSGNSKVR